MSRMIATLLITLAMTTALASTARAQARARNAPSEPSYQFRTREQLAAEAGWPGPTRLANKGAIQLARHSERGLPPAPPSEDDLLPTGPVFDHHGQALSVREYSRIYIDAVPRREIKLHDIVTIIVDEKSEVIMNQKFNRQKNAGLKADLKSFVRFGEGGNLANAAGNNPKIDGQLSGTLNTTGLVTDQEGIKYRIAAKVADVKPNGTILLEARKIIQTQDDISEYTLTGEVRSSDVNPDNTASSENIANLQIVKKAEGRVYNSTKRNWGVRILDIISPF